jgi:hypothetical protein
MWFRTATASRSDSTSDGSRRRVSLAPAWWAALAVLLGAAPASAGLKLDSFRGHVALGYGVLVANRAPGGSLSFAAGIEYPVRPTLDTGIEIGSSLLGTRLIDSGSLGAEVDYSLFEVVAFARWTPPVGPFTIAAGPGAFHARADLTSSSPVEFSDFALDKTRAGMAIDLTVIPRRRSPVRAGLELGLRTLWLPTLHPFSEVPVPTPTLTNGTWTVVTARLAIHY